MVGSLLHRRPPPALVARQIHDASGGTADLRRGGRQGPGRRGHPAGQGAGTPTVSSGPRRTSRSRCPRAPACGSWTASPSCPRTAAGFSRPSRSSGGEGCADGCSRPHLDGPVEVIQIAVDDLVQRGWIMLEQDQHRTYARWRQMLAEPIVRDQLHPCRRFVLEDRIIDRSRATLRSTRRSRCCCRGRADRRGPRAGPRLGRPPPVPQPAASPRCACSTWSSPTSPRRTDDLPHHPVTAGAAARHQPADGATHGPSHGQVPRRWPRSSAQTRAICSAPRSI